MIVPFAYGFDAIKELAMAEQQDGYNREDKDKKLNDDLRKSLTHERPDPKTDPPQTRRTDSSSRPKDEKPKH